MGAHAAMKVTRPVMVMALLYFSFTDPRRSQKKIVDAIIEARVKERELYTRSNCAAFIGYIMVCEVLKREPVRHGVRVGARVHRFRACKSGRAQRSATRTGDGSGGVPTVPNLMTRSSSSEGAENFRRQARLTRSCPSDLRRSSSIVRAVSLR